MADCCLTTPLTVSPVPENCASGQPVCMGIDEAGRGPVLGMLSAAAACMAWVLPHVLPAVCTFKQTRGKSPSPHRLSASLSACLFARFAGAMLYGAAYWPISENETLAKMGFDGAASWTAGLSVVMEHA
jgi:hypothetical protein